MKNIRLLVFSIILIFTVENVSGQFWGAKSARPIDTPKDSLKKGEFTWAPELSPTGPIVVAVNLDEQFAYTYRNGELIGVARVSTGKAGHRTPTGVFVTLLKDAKHHSSKYNNASMPFTQRLTNAGISLHAGGLPGYPSSHGCVHLPSEYARLLFKESPLGMTVVITDISKDPEEISHPSFLSPIYKDGKIQPHERLSDKIAYVWKPELSEEGPVSMIISGSDKRLIVLRNGIEIGRCRISIKNELDSLGTHIYIAHDNKMNQPAVNSTPPQIKLMWIALPLEDINYGKTKGHPIMEGRIKIPDAFLRLLDPLYVTGTHLLVTDASILAGSTGKKMTVMTSHPNVAE